MNPKKGFTLVEVLIVLSVVAIIAIIGMLFLGGAMGWNKESAEKNAQVFISGLELDVDKLQCNGNDSDGDGYVSCTFKMKDGSTRQYECVGWSWFNEGCREPKMAINRQGVSVQTHND